VLTRGLRNVTVHLVMGLLILLLQGGCGMRIATTADRRASLAPYSRANIDSEPFERYLLGRTALLVSAPAVGPILPSKPEPWDSERIRVYAFGGNHSVAAAIDHRGYFLTTSHSVEKGAPYLTFRSGGRVRVVPARIVWQGNRSKREPDLAILHVPHRIDHVFKWASLSEVGPVAFATGLDPDGPRLCPECISGHVARVSRHSNRYPAVASIFHDAPVHRGDSGGPLTTPDGELLGINVLLRLSIFQPRPICIACRPDLEWLHSVIERDAHRPVGP